MGPGQDDMQSEDKVTVPRLNDTGSNWVNYHNCVLWLLDAQTIDVHIEHNSPTTEYTNQGKIGRLETAECWQKEENIIKQVIGASVPRSTFTCIKGQKSVKDIWAVLKTIYEDKMRALATNLMYRFRNVRCGKNNNVHTHFQTLGELKEQLAAMGKVINDEDYTDILLASLPSSYDQSCSSISNNVCISTTPLTTAMFKSMIIDEYMRHEIKKQSNVKDEAFAADASKSKKQCSNCNKHSHLKADCWAKGGSKEGQGPRRNKDKDKSKESLAAAEQVDLVSWATIVSTEDDDDEDWVKTTAAAGMSPMHLAQVHRTATELYDSSTSRHMSPFWEQFTNYQAIELLAITAANKQAFYAFGTGDLWIEVPHGESSTSVLLKDVLHAPDMG